MLMSHPWHRAALAGSAMTGLAEGRGAWAYEDKDGPRCVTKQHPAHWGLWVSLVEDNGERPATYLILLENQWGAWWSH